MISVPMTVSANTESIPMGVDGGTREVAVGVDAQYVVEVSSDYELLTNKPQINGVELIGNKLLNDLFPDGIIIDGGGA